MIKIRVTTHSGSDEIIEMESYNAQEVTTQRNDSTLEAIQLGSASYSRIDLKNITLVEENSNI